MLQRNAVLTAWKASAGLPTIRRDLLLPSAGRGVIAPPRLCPAHDTTRYCSTRGCAACLNTFSPPAGRTLPKVASKGTSLMLRLLRAAACPKKSPFLCCFGPLMQPSRVWSLCQVIPAVIRLPSAMAATAPSCRPQAERTRRAGAPAPRSPPRPAACPPHCRGRSPSLPC